MSRLDKINRDSDTQMIAIQSEYYREIEKIVAHSQQFDSVSEYVNFLLKEFLYGGDPSSKTDQAALQQRLQDLGYL